VRAELRLTTTETQKHYTHDVANLRQTIQGIDFKQVRTVRGGQGSQPPKTHPGPLSGQPAYSGPLPDTAPVRMGADGAGPNSPPPSAREHEHGCEA
jgi:hypothetical protein